MNKSIRYFIFFCIIFDTIFTSGLLAERNQQAYSDQIDTSGLRRTLSYLNLNLPGLEKVKASVGDPVLAADELLKYYRARTFVKLPVERQSGAKAGQAGDNDLRVANNALKHIFVGQSAYPPYFCGADINWGLRPVPDNEWVWQLNRMTFWQAMARVYRQTKDERYAQEWCKQLVDWTKKNPLDEQHNYAWRSIEAGIRGHSWTELFQYFIDSPSFTPEVLSAFLNSFHDHAAYLMTKYTKGSNWALMEAEGLAFIAITFPEFNDSEKWRNESFTRLNTEALTQVYPDGHQRELALGYHMGCIGWFTRTYDLAKMNGQTGAFPESYSKIIEKMCEVPMKLGFPDGSTAQFGDSWSGYPGELWGSLKAWADLYGRQDFLYVATEGKEGKMPDATAFALNVSGFYSMRSSWDKNAICMVLKCGPDGGAHCQPDNGTFELFAGGRHLMPDAGSYIYHGDPENREWFRQTKVHQTLTLNGANTKYAPKLLLWKPGNDLDVLVVENAGYPELTHRRAMLFVDKKYFVIVDEALGRDTGNVDLHFQLAPGKAVLDKNSLSACTNFPDGWNVLVQSNKQPGMVMQEEEGQVSFEYTKKEPRPAFCFRILKDKTDKGVRFVTLVIPYKGSKPTASVKLVGQPEMGSSHITLKVEFEGKSKRISYDIPHQ